MVTQQHAVTPKKASPEEHITSFNDDVEANWNTRSKEIASIKWELQIQAE